MLVGDLPNIQLAFHTLRRFYQPYWNRTAAVLLVLRRHEDQATVLDWLLAMHVTNVVLVQAAADAKEVLLFSSIPPPGRSVCRRDVKEMTLVDRWEPRNLTFLRGQADLFVPPPPEDCRRCPVIATRYQNTED